ncbi:hypothetical protein [Alicyclobacillus macrosporangiidus]|uniref:Uncharacterized protein n=1 Tax=Alicyclobacillus macrosporangiidus TaxID=392015 RepID=A0A1I7L2H3_9BACL|nr:hypothetical protein [Alicyclobacillus macrosporangiidus]SFV03818.1 hypothetical protein SAMN05421543_12345 [Alicyclobacillus macrosporangiidus]
MDRFTSTALIDTEQAYEVLTTAGPDAFAIYFILEVLKDRAGITVEALAQLSNIPVAAAEKACYRLGLVQLGIEQ